MPRENAVVLSDRSQLIISIFYSCIHSRNYKYLYNVVTLPVYICSYKILKFGEFTKLDCVTRSNYGYVAVPSSIACGIRSFPFNEEC